MALGQVTYSSCIKIIFKPLPKQHLEHIIAIPPTTSEFRTTNSFTDCKLQECAGCRKQVVLATHVFVKLSTCNRVTSVETVQGVIMAPIPSWQTDCLITSAAHVLHAAVTERAVYRTVT